MKLRGQQLAQFGKSRIGAIARRSLLPLFRAALNFVQL